MVWSPDVGLTSVIIDACLDKEKNKVNNQTVDSDLEHQD